MNKNLVIYRFFLTVLIIISLLMLGFRIYLKIDKDVTELKNKNIITMENEFKQANDNRFIKFKNDLLKKDIVLDNISIENENEIKFDIYKNMYLSDLNDFMDILYNVYNLRIDEINITKNKFDYSISVSAQI